MLVIFSFSIFVIKGTLCGVNEAPFVFVVSFHITTFSRLQNKHKNTAVLCIHTLLQMYQVSQKLYIAYVIAC